MVQHPTRHAAGKDYSPYNKRRGAIWWSDDGKPCVSFRFLLWENFALDSSIDGLADAISKIPAEPTRDVDSYALVNVHAWSHDSIGGPLEAVRLVIDKLPPGTRVVTAPQFVELLRDNRGGFVEGD